MPKKARPMTIRAMSILISPYRFRPARPFDVAAFQQAVFRNGTYTGAKTPSPHGRRGDGFVEFDKGDMRPEAVKVRDGRSRKDIKIL
jgi:hypothetical protein